jgi:hypothetical protein
MRVKLVLPRHGLRDPFELYFKLLFVLWISYHFLPLLGAQEFAELLELHWIVRFCQVPFGPIFLHIFFGGALLPPRQRVPQNSG